MAALKNVDFPVLGLPMTPSRREYEPGMIISFWRLWAILIVVYAILFMLAVSVQLSYSGISCCSRKVDSFVHKV